MKPPALLRGLAAATSITFALSLAIIGPSEAGEPSISRGSDSVLSVGFGYDGPASSTTGGSTPQARVSRGDDSHLPMLRGVLRPTAQVLAAKGGRGTVIGKVKDLDDLAPGENTLLKHLPDQGNPRVNWKQNAGVRRREMSKGRPIRDASVDPRTGDLIEYPGSFLNAERALLRDRGWSYDPGSRQWSPPR